jgi:polyferredoxin
LNRRLKLIRVVVALAIFAGLTAALADFRGAISPRVGHWLASAQFVPSLMVLTTGAAFGICAVIILLVTLAAGRVYCSAICPLGILQDIIARVSSWWPGRKQPRRRYAPPSTWIRQTLLWVTVAGVVAGWGGFALAVFDPYSNFGRIASGLFRPLLTLANNAVVGPANAIGLTGLYRVEPHWASLWVLHLPILLLVVLVVLVVWRGRLYCNTLCPLGTLLGMFARKAAFRLEIDKNACTKCAACMRICKAQCIELRSGSIDFSRCVACYDCIGACDHGGIGYNLAWRRGRPSPASAPAASPAAGEVPDPARRAFITGAATALAVSIAGSARLQAGPQAHDRDAAEPGGDRRTGPHTQTICPPGSGGIERFLDRCTACQLCVSACPTHVLQPTWTGYGLAGIMKPRMDYSIAFCNFECRICGEVCPSGAITLLDLAEKQVTQIGEAHFDEKKCIVTVKGTDCAACSEHCPTKAVYTVPYGDNLRLPKVNPALCIGCGGCQYACPALPEKAITVASRNVHGRAEKPVEQKVAPAAPAGDFPF